MAVCTFCGHRRIPDAVRPQLEALIEKHITEYGVTEFWVGNYGQFDRMARAAVCEAKRVYPHVRLCLLLPYMLTEDISMDIVGVDEVIIPSAVDGVPKRAAILRLNRYMIDHADYLITYVKYISNGAYKTLEYARKKNDLEIWMFSPV